jgi:hypothetical protein
MRTRHRKPSITAAVLPPILPTDADLAQVVPRRRERRVRSSTRQFVVGLFGGATLVLTPTLLMVARLGA